MNDDLRERVARAILADDIAKGRAHGPIAPLVSKMYDNAAAVLAVIRPEDKPRRANPNQPDRCPSIDPYGTLQCGRLLHPDDQCHFGAIAWKKGAVAARPIADAWRAEGRDVMFNTAGDDLSPQQRVEKWLRGRAAND